MIDDLLRYRAYRRAKSLLLQSSDRVKIEQVLGLRELIQQLFAASPFYGDRLRRSGNRPGDLRTVKDLAGMPATSAAELAAWIRAGDPSAAWGAGAADAHEAREAAAGVAWASMPGAVGPRAEREASAWAGGGAGENAVAKLDAPRGGPQGASAAFSFDTSGRVIPLPPGLDARAQLVQLFALLSASGVGARDDLWIASGEALGLATARGRLLFRARASATLDDTADRPRLIDPGQFPELLARTRRGPGESGRDGRVGARAARTFVLGAPVPADVLGALGVASDAAPRAVLGSTLFGPIAWQCSAGAIHTLGARAVVEPATEAHVERGLTGGSRASRAPRTAGELHLTLIERSPFPVFRAALGLRGRFVGAGCACGARSDRLEMDVPFLGPLRVAGGAFLDPLPIVRAAAASEAIHRVALLQEEECRLRLLVAVASESGAGPSRVAGAAREDATRADTPRAVAAALARLAVPAGVVIVPEIAAEGGLAFPERGFIRGLAHGPLLSIGAIGD